MVIIDNIKQLLAILCNFGLFLHSLQGDVTSKMFSMCVTAWGEEDNEQIIPEYIDNVS